MDYLQMKFSKSLVFAPCACLSMDQQRHVLSLDDTSDYSKLSSGKKDKAKALFWSTVYYVH